jgi:hypothetical protein
MAVSWKRILDLVPTLVTSVLPGLLAGGAVSRVAGKAAAKKGLAGAVFDYPPLPGDFNYQVTKLSNKTWVTGKDGKPHETTLPALNPNIDYANADAALVQTIQGHNQAVRNGTEGTMVQWWPGQDTKPRVAFGPSSSAVRGVKIGKDGKIYIQWHGKNSKWYRYRGGTDLRDTTDIVKSLLTSPSIGRAVARMAFGKYPTKYRHTDSKDLIGKPTYDPQMGWFGKKYYDAEAAGG